MSQPHNTELGVNARIIQVSINGVLISADSYILAPDLTPSQEEGLTLEERIEHMESESIICTLHLDAENMEMLSRLNPNTGEKE